MGFNDQAKSLQGARGGRKFIFKEGVRYKHMTGKQAIVFRLMPAFNPADQNAATSYLPCLDQNGNLTDWGTVLQMVRFVGHGKGGAGSRQDLLSLKTFEAPNREMWCPLDALSKAIQADPQTWGYLIDEGDRNDKNRIRPAYGKIISSLVCDILDINATQLGVQLGVFSTGASNKLIDRKEGLVYQPNAAPNVEEMMKQNYMWAYANGDITCPQYAPVLMVEKADDKGEFSGYKISIAQDPQRRVIRRPIDQQMMAMRYNLSQLDTFINIPTEDDLVQSLVQLLNGRSPHGYHEHALLKMVFQQFQIPEPPQAPMATQTVQSGFAAPPVGGQIPGMPPPQYGVAIPGMPPPQGMQLPPGSPIGYAGPGGFLGTAVPMTPPPQLYAQGPAIQQGFAAPQTPQVGASVPMAPGVPFTAPAAAVSTPVPPPASSPEMTGVMANAAAAGVPQAQSVGAQQVPIAPGDPITGPGFNQAEFLARIRGGQK